MYGIAPKLPISFEGGEGFHNTKTIAENTQQNLKNILLTSPGERVMDPGFGVGLRNYLFENQSNVLLGRLESAITDQVATYMPFVSIEHLVLDDSKSNLLQVTLRYSIAGVASDEVLFLSLKSNSL